MHTVLTPVHAAAVAAAQLYAAGFAPSVLAEAPACLEREELSFIMIKPGAAATAQRIQRNAAVLQSP
jgi:hypothetical protein